MKFSELQLNANVLEALDAASFIRYPVQGYGDMEH